MRLSVTRPKMTDVREFKSISDAARQLALVPDDEFAYIERYAIAEQIMKMEIKLVFKMMAYQLLAVVIGLALIFELMR